MKKKIIGMFICLLLIATAIPLTIEASGGPEVVADISGGFGLTVVIKNIGDITFTNCTVDVSIDGGIFVLDRQLSSEIIPILHPGEEATVKLFLFGLGRVTISINMWMIWTVDCLLVGPFVFLLDGNMVI